MLVHLALAIEDAALRARLRQLATGPDTVVGELAADAWLAEIRRVDCDLIVVDRAALPEPAADVVRALRTR